MPYIRPDRKGELDRGAAPANTGDLTYVLQHAIEGYLIVNGLRYQQIAEVLGAIEGAKLDFTSRVILPYEKRKQEENGDVWSEDLL